MNRLVAVSFFLFAGLAVPGQAFAQASAPNAGFPFKDTSMLKPPPGAKVAIWEFEDLECPLCAHDFPIVRGAVEHYKIAYERHDFPLTEIHIWSFDAAVTARYLQDKVSPALAETFRRDVFAGQQAIASRDDLAAFTRRWFQAHGQSLPFVMDATGNCKAEVKSDRALGERVGVHATPCIFVVTQAKWVHIDDIKELNRAIEMALAKTGGPVAAGRRTARP